MGRRIDFWGGPPKKRPSASLRLTAPLAAARSSFSAPGSTAAEPANAADQLTWGPHLGCCWPLCRKRDFLCVEWNERPVLNQKVKVQRSSQIGIKKYPPRLPTRDPGHYKQKALAGIDHVGHAAQALGITWDMNSLRKLGKQISPLPR